MKTPTYTLTGALSGTPVKLPALKAHLRITHDSEDGILQTYLDAAVEEVERLTNRLMRSGTFQGSYPWFETAPTEQFPFIELGKAPVTAFTSLEIWTGTAFETVASANYNVSARDDDFWRVQIAYPADIAVDIDRDSAAFPIRVTFTAGYGSGTVPAGLKLAVMHYAGWLNENRGDCDGAKVPPTLNALIARWRLLRTY